MKCKFRIINFLVIKFNPCYYHIYQRVVVKWRSGKVCNAGIHPPSKFGKICTERKSGECKNRFKADLSSFLASFTAQIFCSFKTGLGGGWQARLPRLFGQEWRPRLLRQAWTVFHHVGAKFDAIKLLFRFGAKL